MGFSLGPPPCRHPPSLVVSYLGRPVGKAFTTTAGHPGLAGLIHAGDTPSRYIPNRLRTGSFEVGDLVLRLKQKKVHKLASPWEGPFIITEVIGGGAYRLKHAKTGELSHNPWNVAQLRRFYA